MNSTEQGIQNPALSIEYFEVTGTIHDKEEV